MNNSVSKQQVTMIVMQTSQREQKELKAALEVNFYENYVSMSLMMQRDSVKSFFQAILDRSEASPPNSQSFYISRSGVEPNLK